MLLVRREVVVSRLVHRSRAVAASAFACLLAVGAASDALAQPQLMTLDAPTGIVPSGKRVSLEAVLNGPGVANVIVISSTPGLVGNKTLSGSCNAPRNCSTWRISTTIETRYLCQGTAQVRLTGHWNGTERVRMLRLGPGDGGTVAATSPGEFTEQNPRLTWRITEPGCATTQRICYGPLTLLNDVRECRATTGVRFLSTANRTATRRQINETLPRNSRWMWVVERCSATGLCSRTGLGVFLIR